MSMAAAQRLAAESIGAVLGGRNLTDALNDLNTPSLPQETSGALQDLAYGSLRHIFLLRGLLRLMVPKPPPDEISNLLIVALYQLQFTQNAPHAVVHEAVARTQNLFGGKFKSLANAVLRNFQRRREALLSEVMQNDSARYNLPPWWLDNLRAHYPETWHPVVEAFAGKPPMTLRVNCRHCDAEQYLQQLQQAGIGARRLGPYAVMLDKPVPVRQLPGFDEGTVSVQDWGAQQAALMLGAQNGERILDACAAPGGKTGHILETADCDMTALDIDAGRLARVESNLNRLGFSAALHCADARDTASWYDGRLFDAVLADVPCTASGVVKRHPDIRVLRRKGDAGATAEQQVSLLDALWSVLKPGGRMLFATCSIFQEENRQQLSHFLQRHKNAAEREVRVLLPDGIQDGFFYALVDKS